MARTENCVAQVRVLFDTDDVNDVITVMVVVINFLVTLCRFRFERNRFQAEHPPISVRPATIRSAYTSWFDGSLFAWLRVSANFSRH